MIEPQVQWVAPAPLWPGFVQAITDSDRARLRRPDILRFATDSFMDEFMGALANKPQQLYQWRVQPETWETPARDPDLVTSLPALVQRMHRLRESSGSGLVPDPTADVPPLGATAGAGQALKLYQPGHMRFYLITACLVCRIPGLPDRVLNTGNAESAGYVIRRLRPKAGATSLPTTFDLATCDEYAFVDGKRWELTTENDLQPGEEVLPMFGVSYVEHDGRRRRILAGTVPVGKRETYLGASVTPILPTDGATLDPVDRRKAIFLRKVGDAWRSMLIQYDNAYTKLINQAPSPDKAAQLKTATEDQANYQSWLLLLDFGDFLARFLPNVWGAVTSATNASSLDTQAKTLYDALQQSFATDPVSGISHSLIEGLVKIRDFRDNLETSTVPYSTAPDAPSNSGIFPDFLFPLQSDPLRYLVDAPLLFAKTLDDMVDDALKNVAIPDRTPPLPLAGTTASLDLREPGWFIIRCVFARPNCVPLAGPLLSEPTDPFQMATFFDPEAPARPVRIALPLDITPAGLRKFDRNTAFLISDSLCSVLPTGKGGLTFMDLVLSVLPWPFHKDLPTPQSGACQDSGISIGLICSLSIPIITICALILLMIIVNLFDIIFHWVPYFISCFPLPHFSAKRSS